MDVSIRPPGPPRRRRLRGAQDGARPRLHDRRHGVMGREVSLDLAADATARGRLCAFLRSVAGAGRATITAIAPLRGGAIQENWSLDIELEGGTLAGRHAVVLRTDAPSRVAASHL